MQTETDLATVFVEGLIAYYGEYRGLETKAAVVKWLQQRKLSQQRLRELYRWCQENVSTYPPDIAQLRQALRNLADLPREYVVNGEDMKLLEDGTEERKAELAELLANLHAKLTRRHS